MTTDAIRKRGEQPWAAIGALAVLLLALIVAAVIQGNFLLAGRDLLIIFDAVLVVVLVMVLLGKNKMHVEEPASTINQANLTIDAVADAIDRAGANVKEITANPSRSGRALKERPDFVYDDNA